MERRAALVLLASGVGLFPGLGEAASRNRPHPASRSGESESTVGARRPDLRNIGPSRRVRYIRHTSGTYRVVAADGSAVEFPESALGFKIDSSRSGPARGAPAMVVAGRVGDRGWIVFAAPDEISTFVKRQA